LKKTSWRAVVKPTDPGEFPQAFRSQKRKGKCPAAMSLRLRAFAGSICSNLGRRGGGGEGSLREVE